MIAAEGQEISKGNFGDFNFPKKKKKKKKSIFLISTLATKKWLHWKINGDFLH